ncbi:MAG: AAA family ATPase [Acidimicrobiia bacterium]|nr:AAA family ATPase [Acidimicrobiia bacterium]
MGLDSASGVVNDPVVTSVLFTDLVDSTAIGARLGPEPTEELRRTHFRILREVIAATGGTEVKNVGDGLMVAYRSPTQAFAGATAMQQSLARHNARAPQPLHVRIGLSVGEAFIDDGDYFGESVVEAARLCAVAEGGQILATQIACSIAGRHAPCDFRPIGELELKGLPDPVPSVEVLWTPVDVASMVPLPGMLANASQDVVFEFVGRATELELIGSTQKEVFTDHCLRTVLVAGEAGIGKTAMIARAAAQAHEAGSIVLLGHCDEEVTVPYQVWIEALTHLVEHAGAEATEGLAEMHRSALARLVPAYGDPVQPGGADTDRLVLLHAVEALFDHVSTVCPLVLVLDDLHWADAASLHLLRHILSTTRDMAVLVLGTYRHTDLGRDHPLTALLADLHRRGGVERIQLSGLDDAETVKLVSAAAGHELDEESVAFAHAVRRDTDGNPFFTRELLRHVGESGTVVRRDGRWVLDHDARSAPLPASIRDVVARRITRLGDDAGRFLAVASVLGRDFDLDVLARVADQDEDDVLDVLEAATAAAIVAERTEAPGSYRFAHALIQRTLYEGLGAARRARTHLRAAEVLEEAVDHVPNRAAELARHWVAATRPAEQDKALHYVMQAADDALAALAPHDATSWYRQALDLAGGRPELDDDLRARLLIGLGTAQRQIGDSDYRTSLIEAVELARRLGNDELLVEAILAVDRGIAGTSAADDDWVTASEAALAAVGPSDSVARARLLSILSQTIHAREWERRRELNTEAVAIARRLDDAPTLTAVLPVAYQHYLPEEIDDRLEITEEAIALTAQRGDAIATCNALFHRIDACLQIADIEEVDQRLDELSSEARTAGLPLPMWQLHMMKSLRALLAGDCDEAETEASTAFEVGSSGGHVEATAAFGAQLVEVRRHQGRLEEMVDMIVDAAGQNAEVVGFRQLLSTVFCETGRLDEAHRLLTIDHEAGYRNMPRDAAWLTLASCCASTAADLEDHAASLAIYDLLAPYGGQVAAVYTTTAGAVARNLGRLAHVVDRLDAAETHLSAALDLHEQIRAPYWIARTQLDLVETLVRRDAPGDETRAAQLHIDASAIAEERDFRSLADRARRLA